MKFKNNKLLLENGEEKEIPVSNVKIVKHIENSWCSNRVELVYYNYRVDFYHGEVSHEPISLRESSDYIYKRMCIVKELSLMVDEINLMNRRIKYQRNGDIFYKSSDGYIKDIEYLNRLNTNMESILTENNLEVKDVEVWMHSDDLTGLVIGDKLCIEI